jgi:hypothetical protein
MGAQARESRRADGWGPVCRGYQVCLPDGRRGYVEDIREGGDGVELLVATGLFARRRLTVTADEIEAILPGAYRIVVRGSDGAGAPNAGSDVEAVGGIVRMSTRDSSLVGSPRNAG